MILLGWEIGTGKRVEIPETGHLAWFGQTQLSGKTTALEAIAFRGKLRAVAFITKQGEGGFLTGRMIPPYFSEPTNDEEQPLWRWVKSILEASQARRLTFEESWIIRCCEDPRQAKTLADVHANIKALLGGEFATVTKGRGKRAKQIQKTIRRPVSGINAGVYTSLKAYFDIVMPQLARLPYTKKLELHSGLNVMDLREYAMETQALVIRSVMEWVYQHEKGVRVIVPEAQDFVPQGKNSPVKMACETLVRKAGANKNFMWLDSQDMAAVDKIMLRACSIVGIGVQTEMHEIDRSLAGLFTPQLRPVDIARLKIGEFFVRTPEARVTKCYVQPAWMSSELHAQAIAKGEESVSSARQMLRAFKISREPKSAPSSPAPVRGEPHQLLQIQTLDSPDEGDERRDENEPHESNLRLIDGRELLTMDTSPLEFVIDPILPTQGLGMLYAWRGCGKTYFALPGNRTADSDISNSSEDQEANSDALPATLLRASESECAMLKEPAIKTVEMYLSGKTMMSNELGSALRDLLRDHARLIEAHDALAARVRDLTEGYEAKLSRSAESLANHMDSITRNDPATNGRPSHYDLNFIYDEMKHRAQKDPGILELLTRRPELRVKVERQTVQMDDSTIIGRIARLVHEGYFKQARNGPTVQKELKRRGCDQPATNLYKPLNKLTEMGFLTLEPDGFQEVPEMKVQVTSA